MAASPCARIIHLYLPGGADAHPQYMLPWTNTILPPKRHLDPSSQLGRAYRAVTHFSQLRSSSITSICCTTRYTTNPQQIEVNCTVSDILALISQNFKRSRDPEYTPVKWNFNMYVAVLNTINSHTKFEMYGFKFIS